MSSVKPRASIRISIQWSGEVASEETDTLVLTFPGSYLDLRTYRDGHPSGGAIQWAQAGQVQELGEGAELPSLTFVPTISSIPAPPPGIETLPDQGNFKTMPNGDVEERGTMFNPDTGRNQDYVEVWRRLPLESSLLVGEYPTSDVAFLLLERTPSSTWPQVQSFIGHIGQYGLGISRVQDTADSEPRFLAWKEVFNCNQAIWERVHTVGDPAQVNLYLPSLNIVPKPVDLPSQGETASFRETDWIVKCR